MKKLNFIAVLILFFGFTACSSDDDEPSIIIGDYFPTTVTSFWSFDVTANNGVDAQDFLTVENPSSSSIDLEVNNGNAANGYMSGILANGTLRRTDSELYINSEIEIPIEGIDSPIISFNNAQLYNLNAADNSELSSYSNEFTQDFDDIPLTFSYTLTFNKLKDQSSLTVNKVKYNNVTSGNISLTLSITATIKVNDVNQVLTLLDEQDVLSINSYFGEDVGLLKSDGAISYQLDEATIAVLETIGIDVNIDPSKSITNSQILISYAQNN